MGSIRIASRDNSLTSSERLEKELIAAEIISPSTRADKVPITATATVTAGLCLSAELLFRKMAAYKQTNKSATPYRRPYASQLGPAAAQSSILVIV